MTYNFRRCTKSRENVLKANKMLQRRKNVIKTDKSLVNIKRHTRLSSGPMGWVHKNTHRSKYMVRTSVKKSENKRLKELFLSKSN